MSYVLCYMAKALVVYKRGIFYAAVGRRYCRIENKTSFNLMERFSSRKRSFVT